jgi:trans-2,3-dihydro-3-hydroxyanthranilate isomerase
MKYYHVDVFSDKVLAGNGLTVVFPDKDISSSMMLKIAQEFRQFETVFVFEKKDTAYPVRIFTVQEELQFAGHPLLGAAGILHLLHLNKKTEIINIQLSDRIVNFSSTGKDGTAVVTMNQGKADVITTVSRDEYGECASWFSLDERQLHPDYPLSVVSTGLPYLLVPVKQCIDKIKISINNLEEKITALGAKFVYFFDPETLECRSWDNTGVYEDIATGSAAGPLISYLVQNKYKEKNEQVTLSQGRFLHRNSLITGYVNSSDEVLITGSVSLFGKGEIFV